MLNKLEQDVRDAFRAYREGKEAARAASAESALARSRRDAAERHARSLGILIPKRERPDNPRAVVYFIQGASGGPIKIGHTIHLPTRLTDLQTGSPVPLVVIATTRGGAKIETALHRKLGRHRLHGEWFADHADVRAAIAEVA